MADIVASPGMDLSQPHTAICPTLDSSVLSVLAGTNRPLTGREIARLAQRKSHGGVLEVLNRLAEHGLVDRQEAGRALLYTLNRDHLAAPAVSVLAGMRTELMNRLRDLVERWEISPVLVSLFGSAARGEGDTHSDIDFFVVRPDSVSEEDPRWRDQVNELAEDVLRWTGNHAGIAEFSESEVKKLSRKPIAKELRSDAITIGGPDIRTLLGSNR
jgi:predicted nucleotidyltransferase